MDKLKRDFANGIDIAEGLQLPLMKIHGTIDANVRELLRNPDHGDASWC